MRASGRFAGSPAGAHSRLSGHGSNRSSVCLQAPRPVVTAMPTARVTASDPSSTRTAAATSIPAHHSTSPLRCLAAVGIGGGCSSSSGRWGVQAAAGRAGGGGRGGSGGRGRGSGRDPADDMTVCRNLEDLQALISQRLPVWEAGKDVTTMCAAFNLCGKLESRAGANQTAVARSSIIGALVPAYLPLVPRIRNAKNCSIPLWALGKSGISGSGGTEAQLAAALLERLVDPEVLGKAEPQNLANVMYALGKLKQGQQQRGSGWDPTSSPHLQTLAAAVASRLRTVAGHGFKPQDVSNSLWALKALGCTGPEYRSAVEALCGEALQRLRKPELAAAFTPQHLSNILLALEGLQLCSEQAELVAAVAAEDVRRGFAGYVAQDLSNSAWALAKMGFGAGPEAPAEQRQWVSAAVDAATQSGAMARATPQAWSNLLYALALMRCQPPPGLLDAGAAAAMRASGFTGQDCSNTLYALAVLQLRHAGLQAAVCGRLGELLQHDSDTVLHQHVCNSLWAMAVFGGTYSPDMQQLSIQLSREAISRLEGFTTENLNQLWQAQQELGGEVAAALGSSPGLQAAMAAAVTAERENAKPTSDIQKQVVAALRRLEQPQGREAAGGLTIQSVQADIVVPGVLAPVDAVVGLSDGRQVAVEFLGPKRYLLTQTQQQDPSAAVEGGTAIRIRQLRRAFGEGGVLLMPYWEWDFLTPSEQEAYLLRRLQQRAVAVETVAVGAMGGAAAVTAAATTTATKGDGGPGGNPQQQLRARPARRPEGGGGQREAAAEAGRGGR